MSTGHTLPGKGLLRQTASDHLLVFVNELHPRGISGTIGTRLQNGLQLIPALVGLRVTLQGPLIEDYRQIRLTEPTVVVQRIQGVEVPPGIRVQLSNGQANLGQEPLLKRR